MDGDGHEEGKFSDGDGEERPADGGGEERPADGDGEEGRLAGESGENVKASDESMPSSLCGEEVRAPGGSRREAWRSGEERCAIDRERSSFK